MKYYLKVKFNKYNLHPNNSFTICYHEKIYLIIVALGIVLIKTIFLPHLFSSFFKLLTKKITAYYIFTQDLFILK